MTPAQRNDLRAKAMAATHGPWIAGRTDIVIADSKGSKGMVICSLEQCLDRRTNSDYIASASPDVILALLTQLEEYEEALKFYAYYKNYRPGGLVWQDGGKKACIALNDFSWCDFYVREEWIREAIAADEQGHGG